MDITKSFGEVDVTVFADGTISFDLPERVGYETNGVRIYIHKQHTENVIRFLKENL